MFVALGLPATIAILSWAVVFSLLWLGFGYLRLPARANAKNPPKKVILPLVPALILGPIALVIGFNYLGINLIFPVQLTASLIDMWHSGFVPALVLFIASGLLGRLKHNLSLEYYFWSNKPCACVVQAYGGDIKTQLFRVVAGRAFWNSWQESLPWVMGELLIVECVFNAPGIGLGIWHAAKQHNVQEISGGLLMLAGIYLALGAGIHNANRRLGDRLASY